MTGPLALDLRYATARYPGVGSVAVGVAWALLAARPEWPWRVLMPAASDRFDLSFVPAAARVVAGAPGLGAAQWSLGAALNRMGAALYHSPYLARPWRARAPSIVTVHDVMPLEHREAMSAPRRAVYRALVRDALRAACVVTDSEASRDALAAAFPGVPATVRVVYPGVRRGEVGEAWPAWERAVVLAVGVNKPHKDLDTLVRALARVPAARRPLLVWAGPRDPRYPGAAELAARAGGDVDVRELGLVPEERLAALYRSAALFAFPTRYEGFGLPLLEALALGVPAVASDLRVLREVAGDAAMYAPPGDIAAWAEAIDRLLADDVARRDLAARGAPRAARFRYEAAAEALAAEYERLVPALAREPLAAATGAGEALP